MAKTVRFYRCLNPKCQDKEQGRFWSDAPIYPVLEAKCPKCGIEMKDEKLGHMLVRLVIVHYDPPTQFPGIGKNVRACKPDVPIHAANARDGRPNPWNIGTGDASIVNCPACKETAEYKAEIELMNDDDHQLDVKHAGLERVDDKKKRIVKV